MLGLKDENKSVRPKNHCFVEKIKKEKKKLLFKSTLVDSNLSVNIQIIMNTTVLGHITEVDIYS